jgi:hypothetical protein
LVGQGLMTGALRKQRMAARSQTAESKNRRGIIGGPQSIFLGSAHGPDQSTLQPTTV